MANGLPVKLGKEPLVDAIHEIRFEGNGPVSNILPGLLFSALPGEKTFEANPVNAIPKEVREADPNLMFAPLMRVSLKEYAVQVGDKSLTISAFRPYAGWDRFKDFIVQTIEIACNSGLLKQVNRYSTKYINLIPSEIVSDGGLSINVRIGEYEQKAATFSHIRMDVPIGNTINIIQIISNGMISLNDGSSKSGTIIDVDSITSVDSIAPGDFLETLGSRLDEIHNTNKSVFFSCLTPDALESLEASYE